MSAFPDSRLAPGSTAVPLPLLEGGRARADARLPAYLAAGFGALLAAIVLGRPELAALGTPFLALAALGLRTREPAVVSGLVQLTSDRVIEGDTVVGEVRVAWDGEAEVTVLLSGHRGLTPLDPAPVVSWRLLGRGPATLPFRMRAEAWGRQDVGTLWVRLRRPGSFLLWEHKATSSPPIQVLPTALRLDSLLKPAEPRAVAGMHLSRFRGQGTDFADLRPYQPGDRLRDLSWATSARFAEPWVTVRHSERTGTVVLLLDAVFSAEPRSLETLARAARAAWTVASVHLRAHDRVGLLARGRATAWLPPRGGRRARWLLLEELLSIGLGHDRGGRRDRGSRSPVPPDALIVGVSSLHSREFTRDLLHHRRAGRRAVALVIDVADLLPAEGREVTDAARRIWLAQREAERFVLETGGVPTALVTASGGVGPAISALRRRLGMLQPHAARGLR